MMTRPWGRMWLLWHTRRFWIKLIRVNHGHRTSLQYHRYRTELHVRLNNHGPTDSDWFIRRVRRYRAHLLNEGLYLELAWGQPYEADIVRLGDDYGRTTSERRTPSAVGTGTP